jgi:DNA-binding MarR family transcriptional regulator
MPHLLLKDLPRYECLLEASKRYPEMDPTACEAFLHLLRAGDEVFLQMDQNFTDHGISQGRFGVLMQLLSASQMCAESAGGVSPAELAERTGVTRATMTGLIDTLERDGLVRRNADTQDRRMMRVCLTDKGRALMQRILPSHFQRMTAIMQPLDTDERRTLVQLLNKILQHTATLNQASAPMAAPVHN